MSSKYESPLCKVCPNRTGELGKDLGAISIKGGLAGEAGELAVKLLGSVDCHGPWIQESRWASEDPTCYEITPEKIHCSNRLLAVAEKIVSAGVSLSS
jgi:hypothetical protein